MADVYISEIISTELGQEVILSNGDRLMVRAVKTDTDTVNGVGIGVEYEITGTLFNPKG
jgi:hypothetical protein